MYFKIFKLLKVLRVFSNLQLLEDWLKDIFIFQKIRIGNIMNYVKTLIQLIILIHLFGCLWIFFNNENPEWDYYNDVVIRGDIFC